MTKHFSLVTLVLLLIFACHNYTKEKVTPENLTNDATEKLMGHSDEFNSPEIIEVAEGVHVAIGFGLANSIMIEGDNGNIIVDCMESVEVAKRVKAEFNKISTKPIKAVIYTHNHADHTFGVEGIVGDDQPDIYAHELTNYYIDRLLNVVRPIVTSRSYRMFGSQLDDEHFINCGIGPHLDSDSSTVRSLLRPTITFSDQLNVTVEGVKIQLVHAPGETDDQLFVWLPERKILLPGDNFYKAFPNLYTIRGTPYRDIQAWANSLDKMRYLQPEVLIPSHTRPLKGVTHIEDTLRDYADAIRYVHDQTIRQMNKGLLPEEIAQNLHLPQHLKDSPYLQEFYGQVNWSVKNVFNGYLGWFDGNSSTLNPLAPKVKAKKMVDLAGGKSKLIETAQNALDDQEYQWALELTDHLLLLDPINENIKNIRYSALTELANQQSNPNARNYYFAEAKELKGATEPIITKRTPQMSQAIPIKAIFSAMAVNTNPDNCQDMDKKAVFYFTDLDEYWSLHVRRGVTEVQPFELNNPDYTIETTSNTWKGIIGKTKTIPQAMKEGSLKIEGQLKEFGAMMHAFQG